MKRSYFNFTIVVAVFICCISVYSTPISDIEKLILENNHEMAIKKLENDQKSLPFDLNKTLWLGLLYSVNLDYESLIPILQSLHDNLEFPDPYILSFKSDLISLSFNAQWDKKALKLFEHLAKSDKLKKSSKIIISDQIAQCYETYREFEKADNIYKKIGSINKWSAVGPFDNTSQNGYDKDLAPVNHPEQAYVFENENGVSIKWFELKYNLPGRWIDLKNHFETGNSIVFVQTFCFSQIERDAYLRIGVSGSLKAWVNDELTFGEAEERNCDLDSYNVKIKLNKGFNRILLQLGKSEIDHLNFSARITDEYGIALPELVYTEALPSENYLKSKTDFKVQENFVEEFYISKIFEDNQIINKLLLAKTYLSQDKKNAVRQLLNDLNEANPDFALPLFMQLELGDREKNFMYSSEKLNKLSKLLPDNSYIYLARLKEALLNNELNNAKELIDLHLNKEIANETFKMKMIYYGRVGNFNDALKIIEEYTSKYPNETEVVIYNYLSYLNKGNSRNPVEIFLDKFYSQILLERYYSLLMSSNNYEEAEKIIKILIQLKPANKQYYEDLSIIEAKRNNYSKAIDYLTIASEICPYYGKYHTKKAGYYRKLDDEKNALLEYELASELDPFDFDNINKLRVLNNKIELTSYFKNLDLDSIAMQEIDVNKYPNEIALSLLHEENVIVHKKGGYEKITTNLVKILNKSGIDPFKEFIFTDEDKEFDCLKAYVYKTNGKKVNADINDKHLVFTSIEVGDVIVLKYHVKAVNPGALARYFCETFLFSLPIPSKTIRYNLLAMGQKPLRYEILNSNIKPKLSKSNEAILYQWEINDLPSVKGEILMPSIQDVGIVLNVSSLNNWMDITEWFKDLANNKSHSDYEVKKTVSNILKGKENLSKLDQLREIFNYIVNNIRYSYVPFRQSGFIPQKASKTLNTKLGDCKDVTVLFITFCKEIGLKAYPVLVSTRSNGYNCGIPNMVFNHVIAGVELEGKDYYIELTSDLNSMLTIWGDLFEAFAIKIKDDVPDLIVINPETRTKNKVERITKCKIDSDKLIVDRKTVHFGGNASAMRFFYKNKGEDEIKSQISASLMDEYSEIKLLNIITDDALNNNSDSLKLEYIYETTSHGKNIGNMFFFKTPLADRFKIESLPSTGERKFPIDLWQLYPFDNEFEKIEIEIPSNKDFVEIPNDITYEEDFASYCLKFSKHKDNIIISRNLNIKKYRLDALEYPKFIKFIQNISKSDDLHLGLKEKEVRSKKTKSKGVL